MRRAVLLAGLCLASAYAGAALSHAQQRKATISSDDFIEIQRMLWANHTGYDFAIRDNGDLWTSTFMPDAVLDNGPTHLVGADAIREYAVGPAKKDPTRRFRHWTSTFHVTPNAEGAILSAFYLIVADDNANRTMLVGSTGRYESQLVKTKQGWKIKHHLVFGEGNVTARPDVPRP